MVQNLFKRFLSLKFKNEHSRYSDYDGVLSYFLRCLYYAFLLKLLNNFICHPYLLGQFNFRTNSKYTKNQDNFIINYDFLYNGYLLSSPTNIY